MLVQYTDDTFSDIEYSNVSNIDSYINGYTRLPMFTSYVKTDNNEYNLTTNDIIHYVPDTLTITEQTAFSHCDIVLLYTNNFDISQSGLNTIYKNDDILSHNVNVITKLDTSKYYYDFEDMLCVKADERGVATGSAYMLSQSDNITSQDFIRKINQPTVKNIQTEKTIKGLILPYVVVKYDDITYYVLFSMLSDFTVFCNLGQNKFIYNNAHTTNIPHTENGYNGFIVPISYFDSYEVSGLSYNSGYGKKNNNLKYGNIVGVGLQNGMKFFITLDDHDTIKTQFACTGLFFKYNGSMYLGERLATGEFTGNFATEEGYINFPNYNTKDINNISPDYDNTPDSFDDIEIEMPVGLGYTAGGLVNYYGVTSRQLEAISDNLSNWKYVETGKNVMDNLISLKCFALSEDKLFHGFPEMIKIAGTETGVTGKTVKSTMQTLNLGSVTIPPRYNDFRDYAPFTKLEMYIPCCGWLQLPSSCMGRTVKCEMVYDIVTGGCKAFVYQNNTIVGEISGCIAYDIPFSAVAVGTKTAGMINGITGVATSLVGLGAGIATANPFAIASGGIGLISSLSNTVATNNANYTVTKGTTGDMCNFGGVKFMFVKITRPVSKIPNGFEKTVGYLYNQSEILNNMTGYTVCENAKITGSMLENERQEIEQLLNTGVIL